MGEKSEVGSNGPKSEVVVPPGEREERVYYPIMVIVEGGKVGEIKRKNPELPSPKILLSQNFSLSLIINMLVSSRDFLSAAFLLLCSHYAPEYFTTLLSTIFDTLLGEESIDSPPGWSRLRVQQKLVVANWL